MYHQNSAARIAISEEISRLEAMQEMGDYTNGLDADVLYSEAGAAFRLAKLRALLAEFDGLPAVPIPTTMAIEPDPRDEALASARSEAEALRARVAELEAQTEPPPLLPEPDALMADYGPVGGVDEDEFSGVYPTWFVAEQKDGESVKDRIARLTDRFRQRVNELNNFLLDGTISADQEAERDRLMAQYDELAKLGDRS